MTTFHLPRTGLPELTFDGQLLAEQIGSDPDGVTQGRFHNIRIYEADDGQFIVRVDYVSPFASESSDNLVEAVDGLDGIDDFLSLYDAPKGLDRLLFSESDPDRIKTVNKTLVILFDRQVAGLLSVLATSRV